MKRLLIIIFICLSTFVSAQSNLSGLKFCLDPGHGNYPHDKPYETRINLPIAQYLKQYLESYGAWVILTRQDSATAVSLSEREYIANSNNVDFFQSIHHNAFQGSANFSLMLYTELPSGEPKWPGEADVMCHIMVDYLYRYLDTTGKSVRGDWSFYNPPFNLGVLNDLLMPGVLSEASFWDYIPEIHRLNSLGYLKLEAYALLHSFLEYYSVPRRETTYISGVVEELDGEKYSDVQVTLKNDNTEMTYITDSQNIGITEEDLSWSGFPYVPEVKNGMYFFEGFPAGSAELIFQREDLVPDTLSLNIQTATATKAPDMQLFENVPPTVVSTIPENNTTDFSVFSTVTINFSRPMLKSSVLNSLSLVPNVEGKFQWKNISRQLIFTPGTRFEFDQAYQLEILPTAMDQFGFSLDGNGDGQEGDSFELSFHTAQMDTAQPMVIDFYPTNNDTGIFINDILRVTFNKKLDPTTIAGSNILLMSDISRRISVAANYFAEGGLGHISIIPQQPMKSDMGYRLTLVNVIRDLQGNGMDDHFHWDFRTCSKNLNIFPIEDFEQSGSIPSGWDLISSSEQDSLKLNDQIFSQGEKSAQLIYHFENASDSIAIIFSRSEDSLQLKADAIFSTNIFGDAGDGIIKFLFEDPTGWYASQPKVLDWENWRNVRIDLTQKIFSPWGNDNPGVGEFDITEAYFRGIGFKASAIAEGTLYLDKIEQLSASVPTRIQIAKNQKPNVEKFVLHNNYPNPFNPATTISYDLPVGSSHSVKLKIFDVTGREIKLLVNKVQVGGRYQVSWDARNNLGNRVSSGVYFYQLQIENSSLTKKMILMQ